MPSAHLPAEVTVRYWAGARAAAGIESETVAAGTVGEVLEQVRARHTGAPCRTTAVSHPAVGPEGEVVPSIILTGWPCSCC